MQRLIESGPHKGKPALTKIEVLITRTCSLKCQGCSIIRVDEKGRIDYDQSHREEIPMEMWYKTLDAAKEVGTQFLAIYGAEPAMVPERVAQFVNYATNVVQIPNSVITSGVQLTEDTLDYWWANGLRSLTMSVDGLADSVAEQSSNKSSFIKTNHAYRFLNYFMEKYGKDPKFRDIEACQTISLRNVRAIPQLIRELTAIGCWWHGDIIHKNRGKFYSKVEQGVDLHGLMFETPEDIATLKEVTDELLVMKTQGYLIHPSSATLRDMPTMGPAMSWQCCNNADQFLGMASVDCDGTLRVCDDFTSPELRPPPGSSGSAPEDYGHSVGKGKLRLNTFPVKPNVIHNPIMGWELSTRFEEFKQRANKYVKEASCTCFWSTHRDSQEIYDGNNVDIEHYLHLRVNDLPV
jgi:hypothetical protein